MVIKRFIRDKRKQGKKELRKQNRSRELLDHKSVHPACVMELVVKVDRKRRARPEDRSSLDSSCSISKEREETTSHPDQK